MKIKSGITHPPANPYLSAIKLRVLLRSQSPGITPVVCVYSDKGGIHLRTFIDRLPKDSTNIPVNFAGFPVRTFLRK